MTNSFGEIFKFSTWGESHGSMIGCVVEGVPSKIELSELDIQPFLDKRKPGHFLTSQRKESDRVEIVSGVFGGFTTGAPISLLIKNQDPQSKDYEDIKNIFRPGHADYTYQKKYGIRDYKGGGRASARETAMRVAAGAIARKIFPKISIKSAMMQMGIHKIDQAICNWDEISNNVFSCPNNEQAEIWSEYLKKIRKEGNSVGAIIEVQISNVPPGLGNPVYNKLDAALTSAIMSVNAVKGVEIGDGFSIAHLTGDIANDEMECKDNGDVEFLSNHAGGIIGGISTGQDIILRYVVKPTSSILKTQKTIDMEHNNVEISIRGRHDPCVGIRAIPVIEGMIACVMTDHLLLSSVKI